MRKIAVPHPSGLPFGPRSLVGPLAVGIAVATVVTTLLFALPAKPVAAEPISTSSGPLAPTADGHRSNAGLPLDAPFEVQFNKPMNPGSVEGALTIAPPVPVKFRWDATNQRVSIIPDPYWKPYTSYLVDVSSAATDTEGLSLTTPIHVSFEAGSSTGGKITATKVVTGLASPRTAFQLTFTRPVKLSTVLLRYSIAPATEFWVTGDDPTDNASTVFTMTPKTMLPTDSPFVVSFADGGADTAGAAIQPVEPLQIRTLPSPAVQKFIPQSGSVTFDLNQPITVEFTQPMEKDATAKAISITVNGRAIAGTGRWNDDGTTYTFTPSNSFRLSWQVVTTVDKSARSLGGVTMTASAGASFTVSKRATIRRIAWDPGASSSSSPWYASERYYLQLVNCTRTGGWVISGGACSDATHHTLPRQAPLALDAGISNAVARPYAKYMADNRILDHYAIHNPGWRLCNWGGYCSSVNGENIASPGTAAAGGMVAVEIFYQSEYAWRRPNHYTNIMNGAFHRVGIGVWVSNSVRVVCDFYL